LDQNRLFAFGLGYSAQVLATSLARRGWQCAGTVRTQEKADRLIAKGLSAYALNGPDPVPVLDNAHWLISAPPGETGCPIFEAFADQAHTAQSITYLSTTGIYGDLQGGWAFEWTPPNPRSDRAKRRLIAETQWASTGRRMRIVRLPGIYGPGRSPFSRLRAGTAKRIIKAGQVFSRIHVDDIASGLEAMLTRPKALGVFHLCDDAPVPPQDVIAYAANLLGIRPPDAVDFETAEQSPMARSFYAECKRVSNARAKSALNWVPKYPDYRDGLAATLAVEQGKDKNATPA